jgi:formylglycine-generating enzyme required for sulfatase activity
MGRHYQSKNYTETAGGLNLEMIWVPEGTFNMGSETGEDDERPVHAVTLDGFWMGKYEVTNAQWRRFLAESGYEGAREATDDYLLHFKPDTPFSSDDNYPVFYISWFNAKAFCAWLSYRTGLSYTLPTEAQWEYAARAGNSGKWCFGDDGSQLVRCAWFGDNSGGKTHPVGTKEPNAFGLHDMHGNVGEWCLDWDNSEYYKHSPSRNPANFESGENRSLRGGSWRCTLNNLATANRHRNPPKNANYYIGLRVLRAQE